MQPRDADRRTTAAFAHKNWAWKEGGGDITDQADLLPLVTPTSYISSGSLDIIGEETSPGVALFTGSWSGSDPGVAARLEWFRVVDP